MAYVHHDLCLMLCHMALETAGYAWTIRQISMDISSQSAFIMAVRGVPQNSRAINIPYGPSTKPTASLFWHPQGLRLLRP